MGKSMMNRAALAALRLQTCAIGTLKVSVDQFVSKLDSPQFKIFGTGFVVGPRLVMTNRRVLKTLEAYVDARAIPKHWRHVAFLRPDGEGVAQSFHQFDKIALLTEPREFDVGLISFRATGDDPINTRTPVQTEEHFAAEIGDLISVCGYAFGETLLKRDTHERIYRFGPVLQTGFISAIAPYDHSQVVDRLLLDVRTARGMSGAPVLHHASGSVIAMHSAGIEDTVAFAIPINTDMLNIFVKMAEQSSPGDRGESAVSRVARSSEKLGSE
jgi:hypothetical protein